MSDKVEIKKVLEFLTEWYEYYQDQANKTKQEADLRSATDPARSRLQDLAVSYRHQANAVLHVRTRFDLDFNYGLGVDNDDNSAE